METTYLQLTVRETTKNRIETAPDCYVCCIFKDRVITSDRFGNPPLEWLRREKTAM